MSTRAIPNLSAVSQTLLIPLDFRALESQRPDALVRDPKAVELVSRLHADLSGVQRLMENQVNYLLRMREFDRQASAFLARHPAGVIVDLGCGLDTRFERMANMVFSLHRGVTREGSSIGGAAGDWPIPPHAPDNPLVFLLLAKGSSLVGAIPTAGSLPPSRSLLGCKPLGRITVLHRSPATRQPKITASRSTGRLWAKTHRSC